MIRLNRTHLFLNLQTKFFNYVLYFGKIPANYANSTQFAHIVCELHEICTNYEPIYIIIFQRPAPAENAQKFQRIMQIPRSLPTASTNYAKFAPFVNPLYIMFQMPDQWQRTP